MEELRTWTWKGMTQKRFVYPELGASTTEVQCVAATKSTWTRQLAMSHIKLKKSFSFFFFHENGDKQKIGAGSSCLTVKMIQVQKWIRPGLQYVVRNQATMRRVLTMQLARLTAGRHPLER